MKLWVISDLHLECDHFVMPDPLPEADVCVVAGDILPGPLIALGYLERFIGKYMPVVCTLGNHDFYSHSLLEGSEWARKRTLKSKRVHLLDNSSVVIGGVRFIGCTLWTDYELDGDPDYSMSLAVRTVNSKALALVESSFLISATTAGTSLYGTAA